MEKLLNEAFKTKTNNIFGKIKVAGITKKIVNTFGLPLSEVAKRLNMDRSTLGDWVEALEAMDDGTDLNSETITSLKKKTIATRKKKGTTRIRKISEPKKSKPVGEKPKREKVTLITVRGLRKKTNIQPLYELYTDLKTRRYGYETVAKIKNICGLIMAEAKAQIESPQEVEEPTETWDDCCMELTDL